ncbi:protein LIGHT-DEPENDENT SHORT HYPOCOTYLS 4-like [Zingiber officinale]|uniref:ALOG domain-containing protein n=1 Tax=Zingiber officinale TaxID=94328 RepID=A0A8J5LQG5_ZINOF|nr:protein LIGHT-DEPENDENT SHORT HYPOCOTYLS 4-like [Zingiber officinale]XP_042464012.1 protein LIGHT-DEPENDENT SHORT HYPOCOTYLS 4-like [Zingiber officinale]KAG6525735.1 hypothetical protein ZIOFF_015702 [Zingiber officinale]
MDFLPNPESPRSNNSGGSSPNCSPKNLVSVASLSSAAAPAGVASSSSSSSSSSSTSSAAAGAAAPSLSRYESQKRRDWNTFGQYLRNHRPPLSLSQCSSAHVLEFLRYLDQFGKTKIHSHVCPFFGHPNPPAPCPCPLRQAWGSLDALIGRLRAAYEENGGRPETNPFGARAVRLFLREVRDVQSKARGISYEKKKRKKPPPLPHHHHQHQDPPLPPPPGAATA